ncbi:hypothetical protein VTO42DRAFT_740 [Malbranchea cinnamomea]
MEDPVAEIPKVIRLLTQSTPSVQKHTIEKFFTPSASFTHPFVRTGSFVGSRWLIVQIYRWYKIMSPGIELEINSIAFDAANNILYLTITQDFRIFLVPFYSAPVTLTSVVKLSKQRESRLRSPLSPHPPLHPQGDRHIRFSRLPSSPLSRPGTSSDDDDDDNDSGTVARGPAASRRDFPINHSYSSNSSTEAHSSRRARADAPAPSRPRPKRHSSPLTTVSYRHYNNRPPSGRQLQRDRERERGGDRELYYIVSQEDLYQTSEFIKFVMPYGTGSILVLFWHVFALVFSVLGVVVWWPVVYAEERGWRIPGNVLRGRSLQSAREVEWPTTGVGDGERNREKDE